ncbi:DoxX family protein [Teichococcus vastitatis]|uniref:DoxX family protein n=1 Tax=Teichococcus vastitatis TaxID=2307076 RepID=A0ABS9W847_9PROT|nr:DoxX family protein [Pseudoroseomonas vastitatis]MCI0755463.1 DoxX family protein [Pseudoroseomonas vastitatis]
MMHLDRAAPILGRLMLAALFLMAGFGKIGAPAATKAYIASAGLPLPDLAYLLAVIAELGGGLLLLLGLQTRLVALALTGFTLATALFFHADFADQNQMIHLLKNFAISGGLLHVAVLGGGAVSLDAWLRRTAETVKPSFVG